MLLFELFNIYFFSNCNLNDSLITELKKKLNIAENKLTDIRLEALSSVHQIDQLKDSMDKMKVNNLTFSNYTNLSKNLYMLCSI